MKLKSLITLLIVFLFSTFITAQSKSTVAINQFTSNKATKYITSVTNKVVEMMYGSDKYEVLDRTQLKKILKEHYIQAGEEFIDSEVSVEQGKLLKAKYLLNGNIEVINITRKRNASGSITGYWCTIAFTIKIVDVETGQTKSVGSFTTKKSTGMSPETSILSALNSVEKKLKKYFNKQLI